MTTTTDHDVSADAQRPPEFVPFRFQSEGSELYGAMYVAAGPGPHPCLLMIPEMAGLERLTSLIIPVMQSGVNVAYFYPRGMWDPRDTYTLDGGLDDITRAVAHLRTPKAVEELRLDPTRIALGGMSGGGGTLSLIAAAEDPTLPYVAAFVPVNLGADPNSKLMRDRLPHIARMNEACGNRMDPGVISPELRARLTITARATDFIGKTLLIVGALRDPVNPVDVGHRPIVAALRRAGVERLTEVVLDTDHFFLTKRTELHGLVVSWLRDECGFGTPGR